MSRPKRLRGHSYVGGGQYFLTFCTAGRRSVFIHEVVVSDSLLEIRRTCRLEHFALLAYVFMPDHLHLLVEARDPTSDLRRFAQSAKRRAGITYSRRYGGRLWQEGYYERVMRGSDDARQFAAYVLANPVRAGLCASPGEYEYLGSDVWSVAELLESYG